MVAPKSPMVALKPVKTFNLTGGRGVAEWEVGSVRCDREMPKPKYRANPCTTHLENACLTPPLTPLERQTEHQGSVLCPADVTLVTQATCDYCFPQERQNAACKVAMSQAKKSPAHTVQPAPHQVPLALAANSRGSFHQGWAVQKRWLDAWRADSLGPVAIGNRKAIP